MQPNVKLTGIVGIAIVIELHEGEAVLHQDLPDAAVALEELLDVTLSNIVGKFTDVHSGAHSHFGLVVL